MYVSDCIQIILLGLALGSIPFGVILARVFRLPDPRYIGSGNIGATNMLRTGNKKVALLTLLLDAGKGVVAVLLTNQLFTYAVLDTARAAVDGCGMQPTLENCAVYVTNPHYGALAVLTAAVGHMYTPWLKFKGGKGMATILGGALAFSWPVGLGVLIIWLLVFLTTRIVSLASIAALSAIPLITLLRVDSVSAMILGIAAGIAIWRHRENIGRLRKGLEPKMNLSKGDKA